MNVTVNGEEGGGPAAGFGDPRRVTCPLGRCEKQAPIPALLTKSSVPGMSPSSTLLSGSVKQRKVVVEARSAEG